VSESSSVAARSLWLGFSVAYSRCSQSSNVCRVCCWRGKCFRGRQWPSPA
jgi:hypothetical protein